MLVLKLALGVSDYSKKNEILVIVPTYNERDNIAVLCSKILSLPVRADILIVDDNSPDGTGRMADELADKHAQIKVLHRSAKQGLGRAYSAVFKWALERGYEYIFEID